MLSSPSARDPLRAEIEAQHAALQARPDDVVGWADLGVLHVESARLGGDPTAYARAEAAVDEALRLAPYGARPLRAKAVLANARHEFEVGLGAARAAVAAEPDVASPYGPLVDALLELGRYEATTAAQTMVDLRPDLASYARVAYVRESEATWSGRPRRWKRRCRRRLGPPTPPSPASSWVSWPGSRGGSTRPTPPTRPRPDSTPARSTRPPASPRCSAPGATWPAPSAPSPR